MNYIPVIGLEIHAELNTKTKIFCSCANDFGNEKNSRCCPVCTGLPGALPVLNRQAVEFAIAAGLVLGCDIASETTWDRKNYFYPDLPKAYQISQLYAPLCIGGGLEVSGQFVRLNHIHLEEDAGKLIHESEHSTIDFNRAGVPLIEIVTEPDIRSPEQAAAFVEKIRKALMYAGVCDGKMEQGSLRVDANVSIMPENATEYGTRTEIKNINSFRFIRNAIEFEIKRQETVLNRGGHIVQETRRYNEATGETLSMRAKENAHDYRYFPDPDVLPLHVSKEDVERIRSNLCEPPHTRLVRYMSEYGMSESDADAILARRFVADFFDESIKQGANPKTAANVIKGEVLRCINQSDAEKIPFPAGELVKVLNKAAKSEISQNGLKTAVYHMFTEMKSADEVIREHNLTVTEDFELIENVISRAIENNPEAAGQYHEGDRKIMSYFMGLCTKELKGKAHPQTIREALIKALENTKN